jgi:hypothetical protein
MAWLESFLAFALTMLVFSTVITIIIEGIHRALLYREKGMEALIGSLFDTVIWPRFGKFFVPDAAQIKPTDSDDSKKAKMAAQEKQRTDTRADFVAMLTSSEGVTAKARGLIGRLVPQRITSLTSMQFAERLAQTEIGTKIVKEVKNALSGTAAEVQQAVDQLIKDLVQKFERFGTAATDFFKRRSQVFAVLIGFGLVFVVNFDAIQVFKAYLNDDKLREALIANSDAIQKQYAAAVERLKQAADGKGEAADSAKKLIEQLDKSRIEADKALADLRAKGVPIGWSRFPYCVQDRALPTTGPNPPRNVDPKCEKAEAGDYIYWVLAVLLAGALVGLGGPFWYDTVRSLSSVLQLLRPSAPAAAAATKPEPGVAFLRGGGRPADTRQPENPVEAFKAAADARLLAETATPPAQNPPGGAGANPGSGQGA